MNSQNRQNAAFYIMSAKDTLRSLADELEQHAQTAGGDPATQAWNAVSRRLVTVFDLMRMALSAQSNRPAPQPVAGDVVDVSTVMNDLSQSAAQLSSEEVVRKANSMQTQWNYYVDPARGGKIVRTRRTDEERAQMEREGGIQDGGTLSMPQAETLEGGWEDPPMDEDR